MAALRAGTSARPKFRTYPDCRVQSFTKSSWSELTGTSPMTTAFMRVLFRVYGAYVVAFGL